MTSYRQQRVSELLQEELSIIIGNELTDSRLEDAMINVTDVVVSPDLRNARVYIEHALPTGSSRQVLKILKNAESFLRHALSEDLSLRYVPELTFHVDVASARGRRIDEILGEIEHQSHSEENHELDPNTGDAD